MLNFRGVLLLMEEKSGYVLSTKTVKNESIKPPKYG